jgi:26-hydroxylase
MNTRFSHDSEEFQRFMNNFDEGFKLFTQTGAMLYLPFLKHIPGVAKAVQQLKANRAEMLEFVRSIISKHRDELDHNNPKDLIDSYLITIDTLRLDSSNNNKGSSNADIFHGLDPEKQLEQIVLDLFSAGVETLKTTLLWSIIYMMHNPEVMKKVQEELDIKIGPNRLPKVKDMSQLTYTKATIYEVMRRSSVVPMGTPHSTERSVEFEGYTIPKNAHVIPLLHAVHMNPELWDQPEEFRPERFLNEDRTAVHKSENFMPFGIGQ